MCLGAFFEKEERFPMALLVAQGVQMKLIQKWLGHSNISTTANIYSHVDAASTFQCAMVIDETLGKGE